MPEQDDTFFSRPDGRLKLRDQFAAGAELIFYQRADESGPKESFYLRAPVADPEAMRALLQRAHGRTGRVRKPRVLYLVGRTRIHLDAVQELGEFPRAGGRAAGWGALGIEPQQLIQGASVDQLGST